MGPEVGRKGRIMLASKEGKLWNHEGASVGRTMQVKEMEQAILNRL